MFGSRFYKYNAPLALNQNLPAAKEVGETVGAVAEVVGCVKSGGGPPHFKTLRVRRAALEPRVSVLDCASPLALWYRATVM